MPLLTTILFTLVYLWGLAGIILLFHRLSTRLGLLPLAIFMGGITAMLQFNVLGLVTIPGEREQIPAILPYDSFSLLPVILMGMLLVYIVQGTLQTRTILGSILLVTTTATLFQIFLAQSPWLPTNNSPGLLPGTLNLPLVLASTFSLVIASIVLLVFYQWAGNQHGRFPNRLAANAALLVSLWSDGIVFSILYSPGWPTLSRNILLHLAAQTLAALALFPLVFVYLRLTPRLFPNTAFNIHRPALDLFTTNLRLEERERRHYSLLHTLSQINQRVVRAADRSELFTLVCTQLANHQDYLLIWIGILEDRGQKIHLAACAGPAAGAVRALSDPQAIDSPRLGPSGQAIVTRRPVVQRNLMANGEFPEWSATALEGGCRAYAVLPMGYGEEVLGALTIYARHPGDFDAEEVQLLQGLADDLAYAMRSLEARRQQTILLAAAETMQDGLVVTDLAGTITYINLAGAQMIGRPAQELMGKKIDTLVQTEAKILLAYQQALISQGHLNIELETPSAHGELSFLSVHASVAYNEVGEPQYLVASLTDVTRRRLFEHQLFTLNRLITELVQIREPESLLQTLVHASQEMLNANACGVYLLGSDGTSIAQTFSYNLSVEYNKLVASNYRGLPGETVLLTRQIVYVRDVLNDPVYQERIHFLAQYDIRALLLLPITFQEHFFGTLVTYYHQPHDFTEEELQLGQTLSHTIAIALQNARSYQAEHSQRELAEALAQAAIRLNRSLNLDEVLDLVLEQTLRVVNCRTANILLVEGKVAYRARRRGGEYISSYQEEIVFPLTLYTLQTMIQTQQPITVSDVSQDPRWYVVESAKWIRSYAGAPLLDSNNQVIGFLNADSEQPGFFTEETTHRLQALAAHGAMAIQNARLYQQLKQYASELEERVRLRTKELQTAKERIEAILSSVPDAVFVLDEYNQLVQANQAGEALLAQARNQDVDLFDAAFIANLAASETPSEKTVIEVQNRAYQPLASRLAIDGRPSGLVVVFRNVTRFRELDQMKTQFVSDVSHELRTPLTNMTIYIDLLSAVQDSDKRRGYLETLRRETGRLTHLIEDLLTISRLEAGRLHVNLKPIDPNELIADLVHDRKLMAANRGLTLLFEPSAEPLAAQADPTLLAQCLSNLLTNAINYTPAGGTIWLRTGLQGQATSSGVVITVQDTGVGISAEEVPLIFGRFYRGLASRQTGAAGTGLGLAISKEIVERMGGEIHVESTPGQGSTFTLWLPIVL